jgi:uncharacterized membrane protein
MLRASRFLHRTPLIFLILDLILVLSLFLAPATLEPGTVEDLDARANAMDHWERWKEMGPFHMVVYTFGDFNCHQISERSIFINGNQMPVCARDVGIFLGVLMGCALLLRARASDGPADVLLSIMPGKFRRSKIVSRRPGVIAAFLLFILIIPTGLDGGIQLLSTMDIMPFGLQYESTNPTRLLTGYPMGMAAGLLMTMLMMTLLSRRESGEEPLLPFFSN